jgi:hypothetical protein
LDTIRECANGLLADFVGAGADAVFRRFDRDSTVYGDIQHGRAAPELGDFMHSASLQNKQYVNWTYSKKKLSADEYELIFTAKIEPTWHLYSQIEIKNKQILNYEQFKIKQKKKPLLFAGIGIVIGYLLRKELESLILKL